jgi:hypothetical protein
MHNLFLLLPIFFFFSPILLAYSAFYFVSHHKFGKMKMSPIFSLTLVSDSLPTIVLLSLILLVFPITSITSHAVGKTNDYVPISLNLTESETVGLFPAPCLIGLQFRVKFLIKITVI